MRVQRNIYIYFVADHLSARYEIKGHKLSTIAQIKQENAQREYKDNFLFFKFCLTGFSFSFVFFLCSSEDKQEKKSGEYCSFKVRCC
jgi:hypothetical protein